MVSVDCVVVGREVWKGRGLLFFEEVSQGSVSVRVIDRSELCVHLNELWELSDLARLRQELRRTESELYAKPDDALRLVGRRPPPSMTICFDNLDEDNIRAQVSMDHIQGELHEHLEADAILI